MSRFKIDDRVRYKYGSRDTGTIVKRCGASAKSGDWLVRWDHDPHGPQLVDTSEQNMDLLTEHRDDEPIGTSTHGI